MSAISVVADVLPGSVGPYVGLMVAGFLVASWGHGMKSRWTVTIGITMIFLATLLLPLALALTSGDDAPRPSDDLQTPAPLR